jgi:hypothetical protein
LLSASWGARAMTVVYDQPSEVDNQAGVVLVDGPGSVSVSLTPLAAARTAAALIENAAAAEGERLVQDYRARRRRTDELDGGL